MSEHTIIRFTHDGHWQKKEDGSYEWFSENNGRHMCTSIPKAERDISYNDITRGLCRKIGVDQTSVNLRMSYIALSVFGHKVPTYISADDDDDVVCYLCDKQATRRSLLHVEVDQKIHNDETHDVEIQPDDCFGVEVGTETPLMTREEQNSYMESVTGDHCEPFVPFDVQGDQNNDFSFDDGLGFEIGQEFEEKKQVKDLISKASYLKYKVVKSSKTLFEIKCCSYKLGCKWRLRVAKLINSDRFSVRTYNKVHTCSVDIEKRNRTCSAKMVSDEIKSQYPGDVDIPTPKEIIDMMKRNYGVSVSYHTAWRGKKDATTSVRGSSSKKAEEFFADNVPDSEGKPEED